MMMAKNKLLRNKKGFAIQDVPQLAILLLVIAIVLGVGMTILTSVQSSSNQCSGTYLQATNECYTCSTGHTWLTANESCINSTGTINSSAKLDTRTLAFNATSEGMSGLKTMSDWQDTWAVIIAAAVVIGIISAYLFFKKR